MNDYLRSHIRTVPDWPVPGVQFRDITPLLQNPRVFRVLIDAFVHRYMEPSLKPDVVLGSVMDELSMLLLTIPIFFPIVNTLDFGMPHEQAAIWFGILVLMTVGFGMLAPPVGLNVYVVNSMAKDVPMSDSYRGVLPFLISDSLRMLLLLVFPGLSLWLVEFVR